MWWNYDNNVITAPYVGHWFIPTSGVYLENLESHVMYESDDARSGTWVVKSTLFVDGDFSTIQGGHERSMGRIQEI